VRKLDQNNGKNNKGKSWISDHVDSTKNASPTDKKPNSQKESSWIDDHQPIKIQKSSPIPQSDKGQAIPKGNKFLNKIKLFFAGSKKSGTGKSQDRPKPNKIVIASISSFFIFAVVVGYILLPTIVNPTNTKNSSVPSLGLSHDFDKDGKLVKVIDTFGYTTTFDYDVSNRISKINYPEDKWTQYSYDNSGKLSKVWTETGDQLTYKYTPENNRMEVTYPNGKTYKFDQISGNDKIGITYPDGSKINYNLNNNGFPTQITGPDFTKSISYDESNIIQQITNSNGPSYSFNFDDTNRLTNINDPTGKNIGSWDVTFKNDPMGRIERLSDPITTTSYSYDSINRINQISTDWGENVDIDWDSSTNKPSSLTSPENYIKFDKAGSIQDTISVSGYRIPIVTSASGQTTQLMTPFTGSTIIDNDPVTKIQTVTSPTGTKSFTEWKNDQININNGFDEFKIQTNSLGMAERITSPTTDISIAPISSTVISPNNEFQIKYPIPLVQSNSLISTQDTQLWNQIPTVIDHSSASAISRQSELKSDSYWTSGQYLNDPYYRDLAGLPASNMPFNGGEKEWDQWTQNENQKYIQISANTHLFAASEIGGLTYGGAKLVTGGRPPGTTWIDYPSWAFSAGNNLALRNLYRIDPIATNNLIEADSQLGRVRDVVSITNYMTRTVPNQFSISRGIAPTQVENIIVNGPPGAFGGVSAIETNNVPFTIINVDGWGLGKSAIQTFGINYFGKKYIVNNAIPIKTDPALTTPIEKANSIAKDTISPLTQETIKPYINSKPQPFITPDNFGGGIGAPAFPSTGGIMLSTENTYVLDKTGKVSTLAEAVLNSPNRQQFTRFQVDYNGTNYTAVELPFGSETSDQVSPAPPNSPSGPTLSTESGMYFDQDRNIFTIRSGSNITSLNCVKYENMFIVAQLGEGKVIGQLPDESMKFSLNDIRDTDYKNLFVRNST
jgi:YD repeat-containing protein